MKTMAFVTGNNNKFHTAALVLESIGLKLIKKPLEIDEIQSEDIEYIARDKAQKAFAVLQKPLLVNDDSWSIHGLNGFPGPYMKSVTHWFSAQDFINLTAPLEDRRVTLHQIAVYQDESGQKLFKKAIAGVLLDKATDFPGPSWANVVSLTKDGRSLAEVRDTTPEQLASENDTVWHDIASWLEDQA